MTAPASYGADQTGLISGFVFEPGEPARPVTGEQAATWLASAPGEDERFVWLHFNMAHAATEKWIRDSLALEEAFFEALHTGSRSTRIEQIDDGLIAVINDVLFEFAMDASEISTLWAHVSTRALVTVLALPINLVASLLGMNVGGIPLAGNVSGFLIALGVVIVATLLAARVAVRARR
ncbi:MAG: CorA family divalent cation transporter [Azoarcus sp.]|nr:CorA family divalent cation transporter [Azoarcus sp.]